MFLYKMQISGKKQVMPPSFYTILLITINNKHMMLLDN